MHCRVINWSNFNMIVSQGIQRPKEKERDEGMSAQQSSQNMHDLSIEFALLRGRGS